MSKPAAMKEYPVNSQKRCFQPQWPIDFHWVRYSESADGIFCAPCFLFGSARFNSEFITSPFRDWKNATGSSRGCLNRHNSFCKSHQCAEQAVSFIAVMEKRRMSIRSQLSADYDKQVQENAKALMAIIDVIQFLTKQGLALRGHHWNKVTRGKDGNFSAFIDIWQNTVQI